MSTSIPITAAGVSWNGSLILLRGVLALVLLLGGPTSFLGPLKIRGPSPTFGQHNEPLLLDLLGMDDGTYRELVQDAVIATVPSTGEPSSQIPPEQALERGLIAGWDPDYKERLGI